MYYDFSAFTGHWPYRRIRNSGLADQLLLHRESGISGGVMSSLNAIFYNDPREADFPLLEALPEQWSLAMCVNPALPWATDAIRQAYPMGIRFLRLYPGLHRYSLEAPAVHRVCDLAANLGMTVILTARMEDDRLCYLLEQQPVSATGCIRLARKWPDTTFLLSGFYLGELAKALPLPGNVWADTAGLCHGLDPVSDLLCAVFPADKLVFGSFAPLQCMESHLLNLPESKTKTILSENGQRLLEVSK